MSKEDMIKKERGGVHWGAVLLLLGSAAALIFLYFRWRDMGFQWSKFTSTFRELNWLWVAAASAVALLTYLCRALRWQVLLRPVRRRSNLWNLISATTVGFTALVLFGRAGEPVRPYLISVKENVPFSSQAAAWLVERIYDLLTALLIFGFALARVHADAAAVGPNMQWVLNIGGYFAAVMGIVSIGLLLAFGRFSNTVRERLLASLTFLPEHTLANVERMASAFSKGMESTRSREQVSLLALYSLLEWALIVFCYLCLFQAIPATEGLGVVEVCVFVGFVAFGAIVQIPGIGGGVQVAAVVILTELFGLPLETATSLALLIWMVTFLIIVPAGLLLAFHDGLNWKKLRKLQEPSVL